ncbi:MAG: ATP-dependent RecD-like DNA helicase [Fibrobacteria bacterium]|nr:ATP-dependent RecD-like DNA helicase [Fibrobacteria bacterium]
MAIEKGIVKTVTYYNADNGYSVLKLTPYSTSESFTATGIFPKLSEGEELELEGEWSVHPKFGKQLKCQNYKILPPKSPENIERYLASGIFKGVGPAQAKKIVDVFGMDTFMVLDNYPERLNELEHFSEKKKHNLLEQWQNKKSIRDVMFFLQSHNLSLSLSTKIHSFYGEEAVKKLKENPYRLASEMWGIGFTKADDIAKKMGVDQESYERIKAGLIYVLNCSADEGHVFLTRDELMVKASHILQCESEYIIYTLDHLNSNDEIYCDEGIRYYRPFLYHSEVGICRVLSTFFIVGCTKLPEKLIQSGISEAEDLFSNKFNTTFKYLDEQKRCIKKAVDSNVFILTGGPGTGKTTTLRGILHVFKKTSYQIKLTAPTGRAAKRMSEVIDYKASTIHRLLKYDPENGGFVYNENKRLPVDVLIIDELSMVDTWLMFSLLKAIEPGTHLIFVGDSDQLPSVGPGKVLAEFITSQKIPHVHLNKIVRQKENSQIIINAHRINSGLVPLFQSQDTNFHFRECNSPEAAIEKTLSLACESLPQYFNYHSIKDIQVLTPMNMGPLGTKALNTHLQEALNKHVTKLVYKDRLYKTGDKVMQLKNNYDKLVFNGDIGYIQSINIKKKSLTVLFDVLVEYEYAELDQLNLAYAITIHKSQGSEFKAVILLLTTNHYVMLQRNLFYTAITRAKENVFLLAGRNAIQRAVSNNPVIQRNTRLAELLNLEC